MIKGAAFFFLIFSVLSVVRVWLSGWKWSVVSSQRSASGRFKFSVFSYQLVVEEMETENWELGTENLKLSPTLKIRDVHLLPQLARENEPVLFGLPTVKGSTRAPSKGQGNDFSEM